MRFVIAILVLLAAGGTLAGWSWVGPIVMLLFLYRVSGIPWTEAQALRSRGEDYRRYQRQVSAFLPLPPRGAAPSGVSPAACAAPISPWRSPRRPA